VTCDTRTEPLRLPRACWWLLGDTQLLAAHVLERAALAAVMPPLIAYAAEFAPSRPSVDGKTRVSMSSLAASADGSDGVERRRRGAMRAAARAIRVRARVLAVVGLLLAPAILLYSALHSALE
jgi:hypothetical protein